MGLGNKKAGAVDVLPTKAPVERLPPWHESEAKPKSAYVGINPLLWVKSQCDEILLRKVSERRI